MHLTHILTFNNARLNLRHSHKVLKLQPRKSTNVPCTVITVEDFISSGNSSLQTHSRFVDVINFVAKKNQNCCLQVLLAVAIS